MTVHLIDSALCALPGSLSLIIRTVHKLSALSLYSAAPCNCRYNAAAGGRDRGVVLMIPI
jgi:hypothetical protein